VNGVLGRLPLLARVMIAFGLVSLVLTGTLALFTWQLSTGYMLSQRERGAIRQAVVNAQLVEDELRRGSSGLTDLLTGLGAEVESAVLLVDGGEWITSGNLVDPNRLPNRLRLMAENGQAAHQRIVLDGVPVLAVGLPLPEVSAAYVEVFPLRELDRTFHFLSSMLAAGTAISTVVGALLGRWAATRALRPLTELTSAAARAAAGDLDTRLPTTGPPDLAPLASAFNDTAERLQQRVARDIRFAGDVSHELRSPLTTMINAMSILQRRRGELPPSAGKAVDLLGADLRRLRRMVDDLLEISKADHHDQLVLEPVDLVELVERASAEVLGDRPPVVRASGPVRVLADRRGLERVIVNLVGNAEQHGGGLLQVSVERVDGQVRIEVDDAGPGVAVADRERVFERFARGTPAARDAADAGVGLGLALVREHVRRHRGAAWVQDRPGGGARFVVELPVTQP
jgi:two-component system, OmpR family, sensor histidine kinase MtrB